MEVRILLAKTIREVYFGGNWTWSSIKPQLADITWEEATHKIEGFNSIAVLLCHLHYYVAQISGVLRGGKLEGKDALSFTHPPINSMADWQELQERIWQEAEAFAALVEQMDESLLPTIFEQEKYGTYYRNLEGFVSHAHYHLGQLVVLKKLLRLDKVKKED